MIARACLFSIDMLEKKWYRDIDFLVLILPKKFFHPVMTRNYLNFEIGINFPELLTNKRRLVIYKALSIQIDPISNYVTSFEAK